MVPVMDEALAVATTATKTAASSSILATALGYVVGLGSLLLYTPIAVRIWRQRRAAGLSETTWWLKLSSYTCTDVYSFTRGYPLSTYVETIIIAIEAAIILGMVSFLQQTWKTNRFVVKSIIYVALTVWGLTLASPPVIAVGQLAAAALNSFALMPQFWLNYKGKTKGDYSPTTAGLAALGCAVRLYTTLQLAESDPILLTSFGLALVLNTALMLQIVYYGTAEEGLSLREVFAADLSSSSVSSNGIAKNDDDSDPDDARDTDLLLELGDLSSKT